MPYANDTHSARTLTPEAVRDAMFPAVEAGGLDPVARPRTGEASVRSNRSIASAASSASVYSSAMTTSMLSPSAFSQSFLFEGAHERLIVDGDRGAESLDTPDSAASSMSL